jgi:hypothetical protein
MAIKPSGHFFIAAAGLTIGFNQGFGHMGQFGRKISEPIFNFRISVFWIDTGRSRLTVLKMTIKKSPLQREGIKTAAEPLKNRLSGLTH